MKIMEKFGCYNVRLFSIFIIDIMFMLFSFFAIFPPLPADRSDFQVEVDVQDFDVHSELAR